MIKARQVATGHDDSEEESSEISSNEEEVEIRKALE